jgi:hypothetical protein
MAWACHDDRREGLVDESAVLSVSLSELAAAIAQVRDTVDIRMRMTSDPVASVIRKNLGEAITRTTRVAAMPGWLDPARGLRRATMPLIVIAAVTTIAGLVAYVCVDVVGDAPVVTIPAVLIVTYASRWLAPRMPSLIWPTRSQRFRDRWRYGPDRDGRPAGTHHDCSELFEQAREMVGLIAARRLGRFADLPQTGRGAGTAAYRDRVLAQLVGIDSLIATAHDSFDTWYADRASATSSRPDGLDE